MVFPLLFVLNLALIVHRALRSQRTGERLLLVVLSLFLLLSFAMHPWIEKSSHWLSILEKAALASSLTWLALAPLLGWWEKRKERIRTFQLLKNGRGPLFEIISACRMLSEVRQGALIAVEKKDSLEAWAKAGVGIDGRVRREIIFSIFTPPGALHDGGVIIRDGRLAAAGALFPLSKRLDLPTELGTRHRAGLGLSEVTDALVIIVSEETGKISLAVGAKLLYDVKSDRLPELLEASLKNKPFKRRPKAPNSKPPLSSPEPALR